MNENHEQVDEGMKDFIKMSVVAGMLAIPGLLKADDIIKNLPDTNTNILSKAVITAAVDKAMPQKTIAGYTYAQATNIIARTIYSEAGNQGWNGRKAIASVIWNRSGQNTNELINVCFKPGQFCGWNSLKPSTTSGNYCSKNYNSLWMPSRIYKNSQICDAELKSWAECKVIAGWLLDGDFVSTIGHCNMIINPTKDNKAFLNKWESKAEYTIKDHKFAYDPYWDPTVTNHAEQKTIEYLDAKNPAKGFTKKVVHTVAKGDSLDKIARTYGTSVSRIKRLNPKDAKDPMNLKLGSKLYIGYTNNNQLNNQ